MYIYSIFESNGIMILAYSKRIILRISPVHPFGASEIEARGLKFYQSNLRNLVGACERNHRHLCVSMGNGCGRTG